MNTQDAQRDWLKRSERRHRLRLIIVAALSLLMGLCAGFATSGYLF